MDGFLSYLSGDNKICKGIEIILKKVSGVLTGIKFHLLAYTVLFSSITFTVHVFTK